MIRISEINQIRIMYLQGYTVTEISCEVGVSPEEVERYEPEPMNRPTLENIYSELLTTQMLITGLYKLIRGKKPYMR